MVDFDFYTQQAERLNLKKYDLTGDGDCYYIDNVKAETELMRYSVLNRTVTIWPRMFYCDINKEIRTEMEHIEVNTNEELEKQCILIQQNLKKIKMEHSLSKMNEDF